MKKVCVLILAAAMVFGLMACGGEEAKPAEKVDLNALYETLVPNLTEMMPVEGDTRMDFLGIDTADCNQVVTAFAADGMITDEVWLLEAKDQEAFDRLKTLAENRMKAKGDETVSYAPEQYKVVEKGVILEKGLYLILLVSPNVDQLKADVEKAFQ